jgi:putative ABC transport system substrate-binding protein
MIQRREFITLLGGVSLAWPLSVPAMPSDRALRVGVLMNLTVEDPESQARVAAFARGLQQLGWTIGQDIRLVCRWADGDAEAMRKYAAELVALAPDVILAHSSAAVAPLLKETGTIRLCSRLLLIRSELALLTVWHARVATSRASPTSSMG